MKRYGLSVFLALVTGLPGIAACNGGPPTAPMAPDGTPRGNPTIQAGFVIAGLVAFSQPIPRSEGPIEEVELLLDGRSVARRSFTPGASIVYFNFPEQYVHPGAHEVAVRIVRQSVSPSEYLVFGGVAVIHTVSRSIQQFNWPRGSAPLRTGDALSMRFTIVPE